MAIIFQMLHHHRDQRYLLAWFLILISRAFLEGLGFPIHPTTWMMVPGLLIIYYVYKDRFFQVALWAFLICLFRESAPFMVLGLGCYYFINFKWRQGIILGLIALFFYVLCFKIRPYYFGSTIDYGNSMLHKFIATPFQTFWQAFLTFKFPYKAFVLPFGCCALVLFKEIKNVRQFFLTQLLRHLLSLHQHF